MAVQVLVGRSEDDPDSLLAREYANGTKWTVETNKSLTVWSNTKVVASFAADYWIGAELV